jgi:DNA-binding IclR family transcriptional regulator
MKSCTWSGLNNFNSIRLYYDIGKREPYIVLLLGKVLLSQLPEDEFEELGKNIQYVKRTTKTNTNFEELAREWNKPALTAMLLIAAKHVEKVIVWQSRFTILHAKSLLP